MTPRLVLAASVAVIITGVASCSLLAIPDDLSGGLGQTDAGAGDAPTSDATSDATSTAEDAGLGLDAADASGPVVLVSNTFESSLDCDGWKAVGNVVPRPPGFDGGRACALCAAGAFTAISRSIAPAPAGTYALEFSYRAETGTVSSYAYIGDETKFRYWEARGLAVPDWKQQRGTASLAAARDGGLGFVIELEVDGCVLVDDLRILYQPP